MDEKKETGITETYQGKSGDILILNEIYERERIVDRWMNGENVPLVQADYAEIEERILHEYKLDFCIQSMVGLPFINHEKALRSLVPVKEHEPYRKVTDPKKRAKIMAQRAKNKANRKKHR